MRAGDLRVTSTRKEKPGIGGGVKDRGQHYRIIKN